MDDSEDYSSYIGVNSYILNTKKMHNFPNLKSACSPKSVYNICSDHLKRGETLSPGVFKFF